MDKTLHIVSFNIPYPADYGGVIDVFYKIKALKEAGCEIILHCFEYGRIPSEKLNEICKEVHYYHRPKGWQFALKSIPYIVATRNSEELKTNLLKDNYPILFEGLHSTFWLPTLTGLNRKLIVRTHNVEHDYYKGLANSETKCLKKHFFKTESKKLAKFESILKDADVIAAISHADQEYFNSKYGHSVFIPAFHPYNAVNIKEGKGDYVLFHGDLSVPDNIKSVQCLIKKVFSGIDTPFIIAGKNPSQQIIGLANENIKIVANPTEYEMDDLLANAQINILVANQNTGIKLKLLSALHRGRHCVVNSAMIENTGLESVCHISSNTVDIQKTVKELFNIPYEKDEMIRRERVLEEKYSNKKNALKLIEVIFS